MSRWPLEAVLAVARRAEDEAAAGFAAAAAERDRRAADLARACAAVEAQRRMLSAALARGPGAAPCAAALLTGARHAARLRDDEARLARAVPGRIAAAAGAEAALGRRREALAAARGTVRALEERREAWERGRALARDRRAQDADEDLVSARRRAEP